MIDDIINRQAAIDAECEVCQIAQKKERGHNCTYYVHGCKEIECLRALPSAQPERTEIIRCKDCNKASKCYGDVIMRSRGGGNIYCPLEFCSEAERRTDERSD